MTRIIRVKQESPKVKTITFRDELCSLASPGQFIMVWIPGVDEIPLSISATAPLEAQASVTVAEVGEATRALNSMEKNGLIGVRGPFGNKFEIKGKRVLIVGGGTGMAPLMLLIKRIVEKNVEATIIEGAETKNKIIFKDELTNLSRAQSERIRVFYTTEDGSYGARGLATEMAEEIIHKDKENIDVIYTCGPEKMMRRIYEIAEQNSIEIQASLERYMRCAVGICGSCVIGRYRVCRDGPVFKTAQLKEMEKHLGKIKYNEKGEKVQV